MHKSWQTPWVGTLVTTGLSILVIASTFIGSVNDIFGKLILEIGVLVAFYYGITGISCAWAFRKVLLTSVSLFFLAGLLPLIGGVFLFWIGYEVVFPAGTSFSDAVSAGLPVLVLLRSRDTVDDHCRAGQQERLLQGEDCLVHPAQRTTRCGHGRRREHGTRRREL